MNTLLDSIPAISRRVPHIALVFREMWDTAGLPRETDSVRNEKLWRASPIVFGPRTLVRTWGTRTELRARESLRGRPAVSHISRKTSEMWGTRRLVAGIEPESAFVAHLTWHRQVICPRAQPRDLVGSADSAHMRRSLQNSSIRFWSVSQEHMKRAAPPIKV
jgi:hypothetical protein